ncbi:MAG: hypothetical protein HY319_04010 [Armatimonadetes bacterium]|nr:hypothetical protein [Armatimonadota bacterium]
MGIEIRDLPRDLDPGQLSTLEGGSFHWGVAQLAAGGIPLEPCVSVVNLV